MNKKRQVIIIGLDGADFGLLDQEIAAGRLPTLKRILTEGVKAPLRSTVPPLTFPAWVTFATGVNPGKHGIFDFTEKIPGSYGIRFVNARWRRVPCFWHTLSEKGFRVAVGGVPVTYPPEPINGVLVCGFDAPGVGGGKIDRGSVYPPEFFDRLTAKFPNYWLGANVIAFGEDYERIGSRLIEVLKTRLETLLWLYQQEDWDCFVGVIGETDAVCHYFWRFYDSLSPFYRPEKRPLGNFVSRVYQMVDSFLEKLESLRRPESVLILISDHGMGPVGHTVVRLNAFLAEKGFLKFRSKGPLYRNIDLLKKYGLRYTPPFFKRFLFRHTGIVNLLEGKLRFGHLKWSKTLAYSEESPQFPCVYLNVRGREPNGVVSAEDYYRVARDIKAALEELSTVDGKRLVRRAYLREEIYSGPAVERAPDILIEWNYETPHSPPIFLKSEPSSPPVEEISSLPESLLVNRTACHRPQGIFIAHGQRILKKEIFPSLMDIAPTVMALISGEKVAFHEGKVLSEIFEDISDSIAKASGSRLESGSRENQEHMTQEEEKAIKNKLRSLGYL